MCLGIPMQIKEIDQFVARCEAKGVEREVNLFMLQHEPLAIGDFVMVHVGYAIQKMTPQEARSAWELYDEMLALESEPATDAPDAPDTLNA
jgi:hydrogenase expression/formation protein HypC